METFELALIHLLLRLVDMDTLNAVLRDPRSVAILLGALVSISGACLGVFLLLRRLSLTGDAISHTVLLGIVVAFFAMIALGLQPSLSSPLLLIGATAAGVLTVILTEWIQRSNLLKADAALGLVFPLLFALAVLLISRFAEDVHLDTDAVLVGEIGIAWANTSSHCFDRCDPVTITPDSPQAQAGRQCTNCSRGGISPRDPEAVFIATCANCGTYTAAEAWRMRLIPEPPLLVFFPRALAVMSLITILNVLFVLLFYKELKLIAFDEALARALGFRPLLLTYALMTLVSLTAVGAFNAVGSILVIAFFVIPPATVYLLTDRLAWMLLISPLFGIAGAVTGYELARGSFLGLPVHALLNGLDGVLNLRGYTDWNVSISASMVIMTFFFFLLAWIFSPRYGLVSVIVRRRAARLRFMDQMLMGHLYHHAGAAEESEECALPTLHLHLNWTPAKVQSSLARVTARGWVSVQQRVAALTPAGLQEVERFRRDLLRPAWQNDAASFVAIKE